MEDEPVNCWFINSMNTFDLEIYQKEDRDSQYIDMLMMLWSAFLERFGTLCNDKTVSERVTVTSNSLTAAVAYYQASNQTHEINPIAGFASFRDSLNHILKSTTSWDMPEEDDYPPLTPDAILMLINSSKVHCSQYTSPWPEAILGVTEGLSEKMINYDTSTTWPYKSILQNEEAMHPIKKVATQDLEKIPSIYTFGLLVRLPLAVGLLAKCKRYWLDDLAEHCDIHALAAKAQLITEYIEEIQPTIFKSIEDEEWPEWAIGLLPIVPDM